MTSPIHQQQYRSQQQSAAATLAMLPMPPTSALHSVTVQPRPTTKARISITTTATTATTPTLADLPSISHLSERLVGDVAVGGAVTAIVAPFLTVIDKALVQRSAGSHTMIGSAITSLSSMARDPVRFLKSPTYLWMWATYAATYSTANALRTLTEHREYRALRDCPAPSQQQRVVAQQKQQTTATLFAGTTVVNSGASLVKDKAYARLFGNAAAAAQSVPRVTYALWMSRDVTVVGSSFVLPEYVGRYLRDHHDVAEDRANAMAQIGTPLAAQLVAGPLHFVGLDCYNRSLSNLGLTQRLAERARFLVGGFGEVVAARMVRVLPGYGLAGVGNKSLRNAYRERLISTKIRTLLKAEHQQQQPKAKVVPNRSNTTGDLVALIRAKKTQRTMKQNTSV